MTAGIAQWAQDDSREWWTTAEEVGALPIQSAKLSAVGQIGAHGQFGTGRRFGLRWKGNFFWESNIKWL